MDNRLGRRRFRRRCFAGFCKSLCTAPAHARRADPILAARPSDSAAGPPPGPVAHCERGRSAISSPGTFSRSHATSSGVKPSPAPSPIAPEPAATTIRSKRSCAISSRSAWRTVRPRSMRASTGTPARAARCSIASSSRNATSHSACSGTSTARRSGTSARYTGRSVASSARASRSAAASACSEGPSPVNGNAIRRTRSRPLRAGHAAGAPGAAHRRSQLRALRRSAAPASALTSSPPPPGPQSHPRARSPARAACGRRRSAGPRPAGREQTERERRLA